MADSFVVSAQPERTSPMSVKERIANVKHKLTTKEGWVGEYKFSYLCMPSFPYSFGRKGDRQTRRLPPFYALDADLPILLVLVAGFQHSLAMIAGVITPPIIFANALNLPADVQSYMISASLIASGLLSMVQMSRIRLPLPRRWFPNDIRLGTGLITVVGTSFAALSAGLSIFNSWYSSGRCEVGQPCPDAWGALLGTSAVCSLTEILLSFVSPKRLREIFPVHITGVVVFLIGASLIGESGFLNWGGGSNDCHLRPADGFFALCPNINAPNAALWGSPQFLGLGFLSFITVVIVEIFGSPFMRNGSIIIGLVVGMIVAGPAGYVDGSSIKTSPAITFIWVSTFKLSVYGPAVLPFMAVYIAIALEAMGDISASAEAPIFESRIQGGLLADGLGGLLAALGTCSPMSIFAQNNGVISLTACANRRAGYACATLMVLYGVLGKISGVFLSIPNSVLDDGVTSYLFASVAVSGIKVLASTKFTRRNRFILATSLMAGLGNLLVPDFVSHLFEGVETTNTALLGFFDAIVIILGTPYLIAAVVGFILNSILPVEEDDDAHVDNVVVHPDDTFGPSAAERERGQEDVELDDKKFDGDGGLTSVRVTLSREVV